MKDAMTENCRSVTRSQLQRSCVVFFCSLLTTATFTIGCMLLTLYLLDRSGELNNSQFLVMMVVVVVVMDINYGASCVSNNFVIDKPQ